jgi:hypothetical protein
MGLFGVVFGTYISLWNETYTDVQLWHPSLDLSLEAPSPITSPGDGASTSIYRELDRTLDHDRANNSDSEVSLLAAYASSNQLPLHSAEPRPTKATAGTCSTLSPNVIGLESLSPWRGDVVLSYSLNGEELPNHGKTVVLSLVQS